ncbi:rhomboid family-domain-containing protein, partial [Melampsora americana]
HHRQTSDDTITYPHPTATHTASSIKPYYHPSHSTYYHQQDFSDDSLDHQTVTDSTYLPIHPKSNRYQNTRYQEEEEEEDHEKSYYQPHPTQLDSSRNIPNQFEPDSSNHQTHQNRLSRYESHHKYPPDPTHDQSTLKNHSSIRPPVWKRIFWDTSPIEMRIWNHQQGIGIQERAYVCYLLAFGMLIALILELITNYQGTPIATKPSFNYMIGPSAEILINTGARFTPCIKYVPGVSNISFPCLNDTSSLPTCSMPLEQVCGFGGFQTPGQPDQTFRFILPMFLHAGVIHYAINILVQMTSSALIERQMGSIRFLLLYIPSGIFGFILGGNFSLVGQPSVGASGAIFSTHAAVLVDLVAHWSIEDRPARKLFFLLFEIIAGLALGLIPGIDNFSHIGGFAMGFLLSLILFPVLHQTRVHRFSFYLMRLICLLGSILMFALLYRNFFTEDPAASCSWCRYLSCWPTQANNRCKGTGLGMTEITTTTPNNSFNGWTILLFLGMRPRLIFKWISTLSFKSKRTI